MRALILIALLSLSAGSIFSQSPNNESPQATINAFFKASAAADDSTRQAIFSSIFLNDGQVNSVNQMERSAPSKLGTWETFLEESASFYTAYDLSFDEVERTINYYEDIASVRSLVYQTVAVKNSIVVEYEQFLWYTFDLIYQKNGWYISSVTWINAIESQPIDDALIQDTIWHTLKK